MMSGILAFLGRAIEGAPLVALLASAAWGVLSLLLSPCHLAAIPLIVGFIDEQGRLSRRRAFLISVLFAAGILLSVTMVGVLTAVAGRMLGDIGRYGNYFVAAVFFMAGLHLAGLFPFSLSAPQGLPTGKKGAAAAFMLGLVFGIALGPCTFAYLAPILTVAFKTAAADFYYGFLLLVAYGIGHSAVIVLAGTFIGTVQRYLDWNEKSKGARLLKKTCGLLVILGGLYLVYTAR
ncbi:MAG TPA: cytochrome c biogenesis protein CcdA [bacterium]|uniref:Thiol:disulfide interchange protein DsbD n=1 Tax=candidate division TA06 bacterium ADurb.Bin417 TaxID=1852828 RepID=A0A1V5M8N5_UNCT6|nr:MAG: Thiol:disulfide interchange protein DsbD precursor [candidate division TA06 bacterium ADurb.Bin417]HNQ34637.1 cytochrome c biogenesis protein CcdA [bacterium]HNS48300.1 cytochrome c biogenesis protein CcdA [bacterium]